jgi:hypothetical protein
MPPYNARRLLVILIITLPSPALEGRRCSRFGPRLLCCRRSSMFSASAPPLFLDRAVYDRVIGAMRSSASST